MALSQFDTVTLDIVARTNAAIAKAARAANQEVLETDPRPLAFVRHVDGVLDAPEESVKAGGVIVYDYNRLNEVAEFALETLRMLSPVKSGDYASGHTLILNGEPVETLDGWKKGDEVAISNPEPYSRKIESGLKGYKTHPHVYEHAQQMLARRFGNIARIEFTFISLTFGPKLQEWAGRTGLTSKSRKLTSKGRDAWLTRQPALILRELF